MEVAPGVYTVPVSIETDGGQERTFTPTAVETERGPLLVDAGLPGTVDDLAASLGEHGLALADVTMVVLTHHDGDHAGGLAEVVDRSGATTFAHAVEAPYVDGREFPLKADEERGRYPPARVDVEVVGGVRFHTAAGPLAVVESFGHTPGHCSLYLPEERVLLAADALTVEGGTVGGPPEGYTLDEQRAMESVASLSDLDIETVVAYHGGVAETSPAEIAALAESA